MSTLEKFGILVILILVVIIGVVAVWGVGGEPGANPFEGPGGDIAVLPPEVPGGNTSELPPWPNNPGPVAVTPPAPVTPPGLDTPVTPSDGGTLSAMPPVGPVPAPTPTAGTTYTVKKGDTLTSIARDVLGDGSKWTLIQKANPGLDPRRMKLNQVILIPSGVVVARAPETAPAGNNRPRVNSFAPNPDDGPSALPAGGREVEVKTGDSWYSLAVNHLGDGGKWKRLMSANPGMGERDLRPGMKVRLPAAE